MKQKVKIKIESFLRRPIILKVPADSEVKIIKKSRLVKLDKKSVEVLNNHGGSPDATEIDGEVWVYLLKSEYDLFNK